MVHQERLEIGEKSFVSSVMAVLATEAALTVITCGMHFSWAGLVLGVVGFCLMLRLANRLYAGSQPAQWIALAWIGFEVLYAAVALCLMVSSSQGVEIAGQIGAPAAWPVILKVLVYLVLGWVLLRMPTVRDFFADKRGELKGHDFVAEKAPCEADSPLSWTTGQSESARGLAQYVRLVVGALIALGILQIISSVAVFGLKSANPQGLLVFVQGVLTAALGIALGSPSNEIAPLVNPEDQTKGQLTRALGSLAKFYKVQVVIGLLLAGVAVARFVVALG